MGEREQRIGRRQIWIALHPAVVGVDPRAIVPLGTSEFFGKFASPIMRNAGDVLERPAAQGVQGFGEHMVVVVQSRVTHSGIRFQVVIAPNPSNGSLDARIIRSEAGMKHTLQAAVGHRSVAAQAARGRYACRAATTGGTGVVKTAVWILAANGVVLCSLSRFWQRETNTNAF